MDIVANCKSIESLHENIIKDNIQKQNDVQINLVRGPVI